MYALRLYAFKVRATLIYPSRNFPNFPYQSHLNTKRPFKILLIFLFSSIRARYRMVECKFAFRIYIRLK